MDAINGLDRVAFVERFGPLFEHSPWVADAAWRDRPFADRDELYEALVAAMYAAPRERKLALIRAHPDLAGKAAIEGTLTNSSRREQASAGLDRLTPDEYAALHPHQHRLPRALRLPVRRLRARAHQGVDPAGGGGAARHTPRTRRSAWRCEEIAKIARLRLEDAL